jgi:hypothetical protein
MSVPHFHRDVKIPAASFTSASQTFDVSGPLEEEDEAREIYLFVVIQQTADDLKQTTGTVNATAKQFVGPITIPANTKKDWSVLMEVPAGQTFFVSGPATGTALTVEYSLDSNSIGFETYSWTQRLLLS